MSARTTIFSPCREYRYTLWREWAKFRGDLRELPFDGELKPPGHSDWSPSPYLMVIGLNPSTADETKNDPTIRRCIAFAKTWGFGALCMTNLFAWRSTDPTRMKRVPMPVGSENDDWLCRIAAGSSMILAAWGKHGSHRGRADAVLRMFDRAGAVIHHLRQNGDGSPEHPLYVPADIQPSIFAPQPPVSTREGGAR